ncbi:BKACE family enzyme [Lichenifustis flavocetrariae]|uniref:3-keto-5-aminohexanoate cleavage protein n=1 Tax=Lichenifustis flavocetrariae TaxID=2949735 RepID=A0AA41YTR9_9HYPH|nr:3-keto-5-aminohexanoate cleavage protein [Lichenifustis flavocetrariae]MCW6508429.1 3-keto-5-aminohexanoate cleavage protein [Lichenifustis flavocetrariae]
MPSDPVIISVAITGSVPRKSDNPALPVSPTEQIDSTHAAFEAGATLVHIHVRNPDETPSSDPALFKTVLYGVRTRCPGMIIQFSTGGRGRSPAERAAAIEFRPDMASLSTGSVNFPSIVYENQPPLVDELAAKMQRHGVKPEIEIFDLSHIHGAKRLVDAGLMDRRAHLQYVLGVRNAMPADRRLLEILVEEGRRVFPDGTWTAAGIGRHQNEVCDWAIAMGGHVRTGLEDNIRITKDRLAASNAELVSVAAEAVARGGRRVATAAEARRLLGLAEVAGET